MNVYTVTMEWEDHREAQMVETVAILAATLQQAEDAALSFIEERTGIFPEITVSGQMQGTALKTRVVAQLALDADDRPYWVNR